MGYNVQNEVWGEWAAGACFLMFRLYARFRIVGIRNFGIDDAFTISAILFYTAYTAMGNAVFSMGSNIGLTNETAALLTPEQLKSYTAGSKVLFAAWFMYINFVWSLKSILLTLYFRMAEGLPREALLVKIVTGFVALAWCTCILGHFCQCTPIERNWQVYPYPGDECAARNLNYWIIGTLNITTDIGIMVLPMPILAKANLSFFRRMLLGLLLCSGIFIIVCSFLRTYYSLLSISLLEVALGWAGRETLVASIAVSAPAIKPLFNQIKWLRGSSFSDRSKTQGRHKGNSNLVTIGGTPQYIEMGSNVGSKHNKGTSQWQVTKGDSEEDILRGSNDHKDGIHVTTEYNVGVSRMDPSGSQQEKDSI